MASAESVVWPHTKAKHEILTYYLKAWFPILARNRKRLLYIDGFAGQDEHAGREPGSALLALKVASEHILLSRLTRPGKELVFLFIEADRQRFMNLERKVNELALPNNFRVEIRHSTFEQAINEVLRSVAEQGKKLAPSFVFIDPFGPKGFPMTLVERIARQPRAEVLINFSYQPLNQWFLQDPSKHPRLDELFGGDRWRPALTIVDPRTKEDFLVQEYREALEERGWRGINFRMVNKHNQTQYYLLFGTTNHLGMLAMKRAMWSADPEGTFAYSDLSNPDQPRLFSGTLDEDYSRDLTARIFQGRRGTSVTKQLIVENELAWHPTAIERHLTRALQILEYESAPPRIVRVEKTDGSRRRAKSYPKNCQITFAS